VDSNAADIKLFFYEAIKKASARVKLHLEAWIEFYIVDLLARQVVSNNVSLAPLVDQMIEAAEAPAPSRFNLWKSMGESALIQSGLFPEFVKKRGVTRGYVNQMGSNAYKVAGSLSNDGLRKVYLIMSKDFDAFASLLETTRNQTSLGKSFSVEDLLLKWEEEGSADSLMSLADRKLYVIFGKDDSEN